MSSRTVRPSRAFSRNRCSRVRGRQRRVDRDADEERRRAVDRLAHVVDAHVQSREELDEANRIDRVHPAGTGIVARCGGLRPRLRPTRFGRPLRGRPEHPLQPHHRRIARCDVGDGPDSQPRVESRIDATDVHLARAIGLSFMSTKPTAPESRERSRHADHRVVRAALRRVEARHADHPVLPAQRLREACSSTTGIAVGTCSRLACLEPSHRRPVFVECRPAIVSIRAGASRSSRRRRGRRARRPGGEVTEVLGCRMGIDDAPPTMLARPMFGNAASAKADVALASSAVRRRAGRHRGRSDRRYFEPRSDAAAAEALIPPASRVVVEGEQRTTAPTRPADGFDRGHELVEVEERLEHEQVDAASFEHLCLLGVRSAACSLVSRTSAHREARSSRRSVRPSRTSRASRARRTAAELIASNS